VFRFLYFLSFEIDYRNLISESMCGERSFQKLHFSFLKLLFKASSIRHPFEPELVLCVASSAPSLPATSFPCWCRACNAWNTGAMTPAAWRCTSAGQPLSQGLQRAAALPRGRTAGAGADRDLQGLTGIAHTRWATPARLHNAHPHFSYGRA
jgi:hypothetical protein